MKREKKINIELAASLYASGWSLRDIAARQDIDCSPATLNRKLTKAGYELRPNAFLMGKEMKAKKNGVVIDIELAKKLYTVDGLSMAQIINRPEFVCSINSLRAALLEAGVTMRKAGGVNKEYRHKNIIALKDRGLTAAQIQANTGYSISMIYEVLQKAKRGPAVFKEHTVICDLRELVNNHLAIFNNMGALR